MNNEWERILRSVLSEPDERIQRSDFNDTIRIMMERWRDSDKWADLIDDFEVELDEREAKEEMALKSERDRYLDRIGS